MTVLGIVAEFNPFHNGHKYLIEKAKEETQADYVIVVMSGNFVQRGEPALIDKFTRAQMALNCGVDLCIELPVNIATASAEGFAYGAVSLLDKLNVVDFIAFGSETEDLSAIDSIASILIDEPVDFKEKLKSYCENGLSFPAARSKALEEILSPDVANLKEIISSSNSILAIEYLKAIKRLKSNIKPVLIKRVGEDYNNTENYNNFSSASGIRSFLKDKKQVDISMPQEAYNLLVDYEKTRGFIFEEDVFAPLLYKLINLDVNELSEYLDSNEFIANRIVNNRFNFKSYSDMLDILSSKDYTLSRIKRVLTHILLDIKGEANDYKQFDALYGRVLGCSNKELLREVTKNSNIPIITKPSKQLPECSEAVLKAYDLSLKANNVYQSLVATKHGLTCENEYSKNVFYIYNK